MAEKRLRVTLIDVAWGDCVFIEAKEGDARHFVVIDSNDTTYKLSSYMFIRKYFEREGLTLDGRMFDFMLLTHFHSDHYQGLKRLMKEFKAERFLFPRTIEGKLSGHHLIRYATRYNYIETAEAINAGTPMRPLGLVKVKCLWPREDSPISKDENNNSAVLLLTLGDVSVVLGGDAEGEVWHEIADRIPANTRFFKVPHHGSVNGTFLDGATPWFDSCPSEAVLGISSHVKPFTHPDDEVVELFEKNKRTFFRTDKHYHLTFETDGKKSWIKRSRYEEVK